MANINEIIKSLDALASIFCLSKPAKANKSKTLPLNITFKLKNPVIKRK